MFCRVLSCVCTSSKESQLYKFDDSGFRDISFPGVSRVSQRDPNTLKSHSCIYVSLHFLCFHTLLQDLLSKFLSHECNGEKESGLRR